MFFAVCVNLNLIQHKYSKINTTQAYEITVKAEYKFPSEVSI